MTSQRYTNEWKKDGLFGTESCGLPETSLQRIVETWEDSKEDDVKVYSPS